MKGWQVLIIGWFFASVVFGILFYINRIAYKRERRIKQLSTEKTDGIVVAYARTNEANPPIVEYVVDGSSYRRALEYTWITVISTPFKPRQARATTDLFAPKLTIVRNSVISFTSILQDAFPKGSKMTVWYNPERPNESYVERYCGKDRYYQKELILWLSLYIFLSTAFLIVGIIYWKLDL